MYTFIYIHIYIDERARVFTYDNTAQLEGSLSADAEA